MTLADWSPLWISLRASLLATLLAFFAGLAAGRTVARLKKGKGLADGLFSLPLVLPPTLVGYGLLMLLGRNSLLGQMLADAGIGLIFTWPATVLAASIVAFPLMYRTVRGAFEQLDPNLVPAARTLGLAERTIFWRIILPNCWPGILAGTVLAFARALGEFGATIMIAGNIPGRTQTLSMAIYSAVQAGDRSTAGFWSLVTVVLSLTLLVALNTWQGRKWGPRAGPAGRKTQPFGKREVNQRYGTARRHPEEPGTIPAGRGLLVRTGDPRPVGGIRLWQEPDAPMHRGH